MRRTPEQIGRILAAYGQFWLNNPDWRFGQLFANLTGHHRDSFHVQDQDLEYALGLTDKVPDEWEPKEEVSS